MRTEPSTNVVGLLERNYPVLPAGTWAEVKHIAGLHDQQAFILPGAPETYGPTVGLYTGPRARSRTELQSGALVGVIEVGDVTSATPANPYSRLKLVSNVANQLYCVFLKVDADDNWSASVVKGTPAACDPPAYDPDIVRRTSASFDAADYPAAVRFDEDKKGPTIGVPCDAGWCEIAENLASSPQNPIDTENEVTNRVKGWHDEQRIATKPGGIFQPGPSRGSITPIPGLAGKHDGDFEAMSANNTYRIGLRVASVFFKGNPPTDQKYTDWKFQAGRTHLWIRKNAPNDYEAQFVRGAPTTEPNSTDWIGVAFGGKHTLVAVPGVARWIWSPDDEGVWVACDQGCCEISQGFRFNSKKEFGANPRRRQDGIGTDGLR